jgi:hypothetical protein
MLFSLASANGINEVFDVLALLSALMSQAELGEAQSLATNWRVGTTLPIDEHNQTLSFKKEDISSDVPTGRKKCKKCGNVTFEQLLKCPQCQTVNWWV